MNLNNKVAIVTGAGSGLGLATCKALLAGGVKVLALDVDRERLECEVAVLGDQVRTQVVDVSDDDSVKAFILRSTVPAYWDPARLFPRGNYFHWNFGTA